MDPDTPQQLADALNALMLPASRARLCAPVIEAADPTVDGQTYFVLSTLARTGPLPASRLAEHIGIDRSGTSRYADRLQDAGLLKRIPDPADRRSQLLTLTADGARQAQLLRATLAEHIATLTADWPSQEPEAMLSGVARLLSELDQMAREPDAEAVVGRAA